MVTFGRGERVTNMGSTGKSTGFLSKAEQLEVILRENPANDDMHTWIRSEDDIYTYAEAVRRTFGDEIDDFTPDFTADDIRRALETGEMTVYSSKPIVNGDWVTPSAMEGASYSGDGYMYTATINIKDVAWVDEGQGQLATNNVIRYRRISSRGLI